MTNGWNVPPVILDNPSPHFIIRSGYSSYLEIMAFHLGLLSIFVWAFTQHINWDWSNVCDRVARYGHLHVLQWARDHGCDWSANTCDNAALNGHLHILEWARDHGCDWSANTCDNAALNGHLHILEWARANGCDWSSATCSNAALNGHLHLLQWARANGCTWSSSTCTKNSAKNGHLHVLQWACRNGCRWNKETCSIAVANGHVHVLQWACANRYRISSDICTDAARNGQLHVLQWARSIDCPWTSDTATAAAENGHLSILQWARLNGCPWCYETFESAKKNGHFGLLHWACANESPFSYNGSIRWAAEKVLDLFMTLWINIREEQPWIDGLMWGRYERRERYKTAGYNFQYKRFSNDDYYRYLVEWSHWSHDSSWLRKNCTVPPDFFVLQWARANDYPNFPGLDRYAATKGHLHFLQWARAHGCILSAFTCTLAAANGHLHVLKWARANGCDWSSDTCTQAAENGHLHVLQWARQNDCPWDKTTCDAAARNGLLHILKWARANGCDWSELTCRNAATKGHLHVLKWARANGCPWSAETLQDATTNGHTHILQWARDNMYEWPIDTAIIFPDSIKMALDIQYKCNICFEIMPSGVLLPCEKHHAVCSECLQGHVSMETGQNADVRCPSCLADGTTVLISSDALRRARAANDVVQMVQKMEIRKATADCSTCDFCEKPFWTTSIRTRPKCPNCGANPDRQSAQLQSDQAFADYARKTGVFKCTTDKCGLSITWDAEKDPRACNRIVCRCNQGYCWYCTAAIKDHNHFSPRNSSTGCPMFSQGRWAPESRK